MTKSDRAKLSWFWGHDRRFLLSSAFPKKHPILTPLPLPVLSTKIPGMHAKFTAQLNIDKLIYELTKKCSWKSNAAHVLIKNKRNPARFFQWIEIPGHGSLLDIFMNFIHQTSEVLAVYKIQTILYVWWFIVHQSHPPSHHPWSTKQPREQHRSRRHWRARMGSLARAWPWYTEVMLFCWTLRLVALMVHRYHAVRAKAFGLDMNEAEFYGWW